MLTYRSEEAIREQAKKKRLQRKRSQIPTDSEAIYGPPDKQQHFDDDFQTEKKKAKVNKPKIGSKVKAKYDKHWYSGELTAYNKDIDQWKYILKKTTTQTMLYFQTRT